MFWITPLQSACCEEQDENDTDDNDDDDDAQQWRPRVKLTGKGGKKKKIIGREEK